MGLREQLSDAIQQRNHEALEALIMKEKRSVRLLMSMTYRSDAVLREAAIKGIGIATRHHPELIKKKLHDLVWAMDEQSGTNAQAVPEVLQAIARERPEFLLPIVPDLVRLSQDDGLHDGIADALCIVVHNCPGKVGQIMSRSITDRIEKGECCGDNK